MSTILPTSKVLALLGVSQMTLHRWRHGNEFPQPLTVNGRNYWRQADIDAWLERQETAAAPSRRPPSAASI